MSHLSRKEECALGILKSIISNPEIAKHFIVESPMSAGDLIVIDEIFINFSINTANKFLQKIHEDDKNEYKKRLNTFDKI
jgi:hypothetical protein